MIENEYLNRVENLFRQLESLLEEEDLDAERLGNLLTITFDDDSEIVISLQVAMQEVWVAAKSGGYHFKWDDQAQCWRDTRNHQDFFAQLSKAVSEQAQRSIVLRSNP